jgi:DNA-binding LacI/PurR family transcriptional regulator
MLAALSDRGLEVPAEVLVASGSDSEHTRSATPAITSVDLCPDLLARVAVTMLVNILDTTDRPLPAGDIQGRLVIRDSTRRRPAPPS